MKKYIALENISGSNDGINVFEYKKGDVIEENKLSDYLKNAWLKNKKIEEQANTGDKEVDDFLNGKTDKVPEGTEEIEEVEALVLEAKSILENPNIDTDKLKEIGIALGIKNMEKTVNGDTIVNKLKKFIDEYEATE